MKIRWLSACVLLAWLSCLAPVSADAATLDTSKNLDSYPAIPLESGMQNVKTNGAGVYDFADRNGDGSMTAVTPSGLNLTNRYLTTAADGKSLSFKLNGGDLTATSGYIQTGNANLLVYNVGTLAMADGWIGAAGWAGGYTVAIGQDGVAGPRAGPVQVNGFFSKGDWSGGNVAVNSSGDVLIRNAGGVVTNINVTGASSGSGSVSIRHDGTFLARDVTDTCSGNGTGGLIFDGDALTNGPSGTFAANLLDTHAGLSWGADPASSGSIAISNYMAVTIGSVDTRKWSGGGTGSLLVTGIVDTIKITGNLDLRSFTPTGNGSVRLHAGGVITVNALNLSNMSYMVFDGGGKCYIEGLLTGSDGNPASDLGNIGTKLRTPAGETIYYKPEQSPALDGQSFVLASPAGAAGAGGLLKPKPKGTVVRIH